jgi:hypothetical protein
MAKTKTTKTKLPTKMGKKTSPKTPTMSAKKPSLNVRTTKTIYNPVSHHIYHDGNSYRVRAIRKGVKFSQCFSSKKKAFEFRKNILSA